MFNKDKIEELYPQAGELMWEPQLCWKLPKDKEYMLEEVCGNGEYFASLKKDGACYQVVKTQDFCYLFGRTVSRTTGVLTEKIENVPHLKEAFSTLPTNTVIVVEIYYPKKTSKDVTSIMGCLPELAIERQKDNPIHAYCHDILMYDNVDLRKIGALERYKILEAIWKLHNLSSFDFLELALPIYDNIFEEASSALERGEEGLVLRKKTGVWMCGKRPAWNTIKIKQMDTIDLICTGFCSPTKEYTGKELDTWQYWAIEKKVPELGWIEERVFNGEYYRVRGIDYRTVPITKPYYLGWKTAIHVGAYDENGKLVDLGTVSSGLTDDLKESITNNPNIYLNKVVSLDCMSIDKKQHTLRHPVFKGFRDDKNPKECLISEIFR